MSVINKIVATSEKLFMTYGVKSISMDDIASDIGISKKTIYKHFKTKDDLLNTTLENFLKKEKKTVTEIKKNSDNAVEEIITIGRHIIKMARSLKPTLLYDLKKYHVSNWDLVEEHHNKFIRQVITDNLRRGINEGYFRGNLNAELIAKLYVIKSLLISNDKTLSDHGLGLDGLFKEHLLYHLYGVLSEKGLKLVENYELDTI